MVVVVGMMMKKEEEERKNQIKTDDKRNIHESQEGGEKGCKGIIRIWTEEIAGSKKNMKG